MTPSKTKTGKMLHECGTQKVAGALDRLVTPSLVYWVSINTVEKIGGAYVVL